MIDHDLLVRVLGFTVVGAPLVLTLVLGSAALVDRPLSERAIGRLGQSAIGLGLLAAVLTLLTMLVYGTRREPLELGTWVDVGGYQFTIKFIFDRLSVPFVILSFLLCGTIGAFAVRYMHRERGFSRFFTLYALFALGMTITSLAGTIETLFAGWELVGLSSALLVAFFHERPAPCRNGLRVWIVYRISDAALLIASIALHHLRGHGDFSLALGTGIWPEGHAEMTSQQAFTIGLLLIVAAAGKSALIPFSGWLPRAMEGPTPSSAVFYGALSVHLGAFLLLRFSPLLELSPVLGVLIILLGLATAGFAAFAGRVQTDIKCALSFASLTQVGIIVAEVGLGLYFPWVRYLALVHILGHGCMRTLQFVRAPTLLHDYRILENAIGTHISHGTKRSRLSEQIRAWLYRFALERGYLDSFLMEYLARPFLATLHWCDRNERRWTEFLSGTPHRVDAPPMPTRTVTLTDE